MKYNDKQQAILLLKDGTIFYGKSIGISGTTFGEIAFNTGTTGYQEIFTDPSYYGQIMVTTNAHIGNYGVNENEVESDNVKISGLVCKNFSMNYSREDASGSLYDYLEKQNLIVILFAHLLKWINWSGLRKKRKMKICKNSFLLSMIFHINFLILVVLLEH